MKLLKNNRGQGLTEYIVLMMLICVVSIATVASLGKTIRGKIIEAENKINSVSGDPDKTAGGSSSGGADSVINSISGSGGR
jgi:Flp pilus assembly pilin Flp